MEVLAAAEVLAEVEVLEEAEVLGEAEVLADPLAIMVVLDSLDSEEENIFFVLNCLYLISIRLINRVAFAEIL